MPRPEHSGLAIQERKTVVSRESVEMGNPPGIASHWTDVLVRSGLSNKKARYSAGFISERSISQLFLNALGQILQCIGRDEERRRWFARIYEL